ncbi:hypothetical protein IE81DRAFT_37343 [Ceraceosorus guamensis]|uniref:UBA domain-containing protein n=1 Tax=Ceraceosorus guamensis TaxID=1522189 RepID=A0A316W4X9_9BASI|nr:hypothetical protein IE81DRAFT_37343 [Ceraceosorus guamensis]PWN44188.1 hypothetical protein IE81DRAFT_37343 [Ceraceosorus guamensis]
MPHVQVINETQLPLHISLRQISPLHYQNNVLPGNKADFHCGRVWFTIEARIDRGGDNDGSYSKFETFAAPVAVTLTVLSLGAGAVYVAAAGGASAAFASVSARVGAAAASHAPTARRLYKYARKGQRVVQIGQVLGIGGGAIAGKRLAEKETPSAEQEGRQKPHTGVSSKVQDEGEQKSQGLLGGLLDWDEKKRVKEAKKVLKGLLEGSVVSSAGWYMGGDRVIRIKGGPRATQLEDILVIETDTLEDFVVTGDEAPASSLHEENGLSQSQGWFGSFRKPKQDKGVKGAAGAEKSACSMTEQDIKDAAASQSDQSAGVETEPQLVEAMDATSLQSPSSSHAPSSISSRASAESLFTRVKRSRAERADRMATLAAKPAAEGPRRELQRSSKTTADAEKEAEESADEVRVLKEMGFTEEQVQRAIKATGRPEDAALAEKEADSLRKGDADGRTQSPRRTGPQRSPSWRRALALQS